MRDKTANIYVTEIYGVYPDSEIDLFAVAKPFLGQQSIVCCIEIMIIQGLKPLMIFYFKKSINSDTFNQYLGILNNDIPCRKVPGSELANVKMKNLSIQYGCLNANIDIDFDKLNSYIQNGEYKVFLARIVRIDSISCSIFTNSDLDVACLNAIYNNSVGIKRLVTDNKDINSIADFVISKKKLLKIKDLKLSISRNCMPVILKSPSVIDAGLLNDDGILIGKTSSSRKIHLPLERFTTHTLILGSSGSGKTTFLYHAIVELSKKGIPSLIFDLKSFSKLIKCDGLSDNLHIFKFKSKDAPCPMSLFQLPGFCNVGEYKTLILNLFINGFGLTSPYDQIVREVINEIYSKKGYQDSDKIANENGYPSYDDFLNSLKKNVDDLKYSNETRQNLEGLINNRVSKLKECLGDYMGLKIEDLLKGISIIVLDKAVDDGLKPILMLYILNMLELYLTRNFKDKENPSLVAVCVIDEAHILFNNNGENYQLVTKYMRNLLTEMRQYGLGIVLSDQSYSIMEAAYDCTATHIIYNIKNGLTDIASKSNLDIDVNIIKSLGIGNAILSTKNNIKIPLNMEYLNPSEGNVTEQDLSNLMQKYWDEQDLDKIKPYRDCNCGKNHCDIQLKETVLNKYSDLKRNYLDNAIRKRMNEFFNLDELYCANAICPKLLTLSKSDEEIAREVMEEAKSSYYDNLRNEKGKLLCAIFDKKYPKTYTSYYKQLILNYLNQQNIDWNKK